MRYPLVTFFIVSYNQEKYIAEAIDGALSQDYSNLEIIISDDCSTDRTWEIIQSKAADYKGPHKLILNRNEPNLGPREHFNKVLYELSNGEIIVMAAGDDISDPQRTRKCVDFMISHPDVSSISCVSQLIYEDGTPYKQKPFDSLSKGHVSIFTLRDYITLGLMINSGDSRVLRRKVIDSFPPLKWSYSEDIFLFIRGFYVGDVALIHEPLVKYRQHENSIMGKERACKKATEEQCRAFEETTVRQLNDDLDYAIEHHYIQPEQEELVRQKINDVANYLRPKRKTIWWRMAHRLQKSTNNFFEIILKILN